MRFLYSLDELLTLQTNGWSCFDCGRAWADVLPGSAFLIAEGSDPTCKHPKLHRARLSRA